MSRSDHSDQDQGQAAVHLCLLGRPSATVEGRSFKLGAQRPEQLLVYLALRGTAVPRDTLAAQFWPEMELDHQRGNLRKVLFKARRAPWGAALSINDEDVAVVVTTDLAALYERIQHADLAGAIELAGSKLLEGFVPDDAQGWTHAVTFERRRLHNALRTLVLREAERAPAALQERSAHLLLSADPLDEDAVRLMMRALAATERRAAALNLFNDFAQRLADELGLEVAMSTLELSRAIGLGEQGTRSPGPVVAPEPVAAAVASVSDSEVEVACVGRQHELARLADVVRDNRFVVITGPGGVGKSTLMRRFWQERKRGAPELQIAYLDVSHLPTPDALGQRVEQVLLPLRPGLPALLLLDNCEHIFVSASDAVDEQPAVRTIQAVIDERPTLHVLCSSQARPTAPAAVVVPVSGLPVPAESAARTEISATPAVQLFLDCAPQQSTVRVPEDLPTIATICRLLAGFPLAIQLAANWTRVLSCTEILADLHQDAEVLEDPSTGASFKQVVTRSFQMLGRAEHEALVRLAVIPGAFDREIAAAVSSTPLPVLASLIDKSLLARHQMGAVSVFSLHSIIRKLMNEHAERSPEAIDAGRTSLRRYVLDVCSRWSSTAPAAVRRAVYDRIGLFPDIFNGCLEEALGQRDTDTVAAIVEVLYAHMIEREPGILDVDVHLAPAAAVLQDRLDRYRPLVTRLLGMAAHEHTRRYRGAEATELAKRARELADPARPSFSTVGMEAQRLFWRDGKVEQAKALLHDRIAQGDLLQHELLELTILLVEYEAARLDSLPMAIAMCRQLFDAHVRRGTDRADAYHRLKLVELLCAKGDLKEAQRQAEENLAVAHAQPFATNGLELLAAALVKISQNDAAGAKRHCEEAAAALEVSPRARLIPSRRAMTLHLSARAELLAGNIERSAALLQETVAQLAQIPADRMYRSLSDALPLLAELLLLTDRHDDGCRVLQLLHRDPRITAYTRQLAVNVASRHDIALESLEPAVPTDADNKFFQLAIARLALPAAA